MKIRIHEVGADEAEIECAGSETIEQIVVKFCEQTCLYRKVKKFRAQHEKIAVYVFDDNLLDTKSSHVLHFDLVRWCSSTGDLVTLVDEHLGELDEDLVGSRRVTPLSRYDGNCYHHMECLANGSLFDDIDDIKSIAVRKYPVDTPYNDGCVYDIIYDRVAKLIGGGLISFEWEEIVRNRMVYKCISPSEREFLSQEKTLDECGIDDSYRYPLIIRCYD